MRLVGLVGAPLRPDAPTARDLAAAELASRVYAEAGPGLIDRILHALGRLWDGIEVPTGGTGSRVALAVILALVALVLVLAARTLGRVRRRGGDAARGVLGGSATSGELRALADDAAARGDLRGAVAMRFRAVVRATAERDIVAVTPGLTAREAAEQAGAALPALAERWLAAQALFDGVVYGGQDAGPDDDAALRALDADVAAARPHLTSAP